MKKTFFARTYFSVLILFLLIINTVFFVIALCNYSVNVNETRKAFTAEAAAISEVLESALTNSHPDDKAAVQHAYGNYYKTSGIYLRFRKNAQVTYSSFPDTSYTEQKRNINKINNKYMTLSVYLCDGEYDLTVLKDVSYLEENHKNLSLAVSVLSFVLSLLLITALYFILKKLYSPLKDLQKTAEDLAAGKYDSRAEENGDEEFAVLARSLNKMTEQIQLHIQTLEDSAKQKQTMLDNLAHEIRTPLMVIQGYTEYASVANISEAEKRDALNTVQKETVRLKNISETLLGISSIREHGITAEDIDLFVLLQEISDRFKIKCKEKRIDLKVRLKKEFIKGDRILVDMLISNLTDNALNACEDGGRVEIGTEINSEHLTIYVKDNGKGIKADDLHHITEPFYRTDKSRSRINGGNGLGLALCKKITDAHNAQMIFESEVGRGTTVKILFKI